MIPKIIHYCWFGGNDLPETCNAYISEWRSLHADWEIKQWDETNSPLELSYLKNALKNRKWANMSNMVRFHALLNEGGIYLDTDMKVIKPLTALLENQCFLGFEEGDKANDELWVNNAIIGAEKENAFIKKCYDQLLANFDGLEDANLSAPRLVTQILKEEYSLSKYGFQVLGDVTLYPTSYFYPIHYNEAYKLENVERYITEETMAVHMWSRSWLTAEQLLSMLDTLQFKYDTAVEKQQSVKDIARSIKNLTRTLLKDEEDKALVSDAEVRKTLESMETTFRQKEEVLQQTIQKLQLEKSLSEKEVEIKEALLLAVNKTLIEQAEQYSARQIDLELQIQLLKENNLLQTQVIAQQEVDLEQKEKVQQETIVILENYKKDLEALQAAHSEMEKMLSEQIIVLKEEKERLEAIDQNSKEAIHTSSIRLAELEMQLKTLHDEYEAYRNKQEVNNRELIQFLEERRNIHQNNITWYKATYENRRLLGIIKDRIIKTIIK